MPVRRRNINQRLNGINPLSYLGDNAYQPPEFYLNNRAPTNNDFDGFFIGDLWLNIEDYPTPAEASDIWMLVAKVGKVATWIQLDVAEGLITLTGDTGGAISHDNDKNINIFSGFAPLSVDGDPNTFTLTINSDGTIPVSFLTDDANSAVPAAGVLTVTGGLNLNTSSSGSTVTVATDQLDEGVMFSDADGVFSVPSYEDGEVIIGSSSGPPAWSTLTEGAGISITNASNSITIAATGGSGPPATSYFLAYQATDYTMPALSVNYNLGSTRVLTEVFDIGADFDATTGIYTAPATGYYLFNCSISLYDVGGVQNSAINFVTTAATYRVSMEHPTTNQYNEVTGTMLVDMTAGDTCFVTLSYSNSPGAGATLLAAPSVTTPTGRATFFSGRNVA